MLVITAGSFSVDPLSRSNVRTVERIRFGPRTRWNRKNLRPAFPDVVETDIEGIDCFKFKLPATALQIDSRMILEIVVEHGINPNDQDTVVANIWARSVGGVLSGFLMPLQMPAIPNEPVMDRAGRITAELNESGLFMEQLHKFISMMMNSRN